MGRLLVLWGGFGALCGVVLAILTPKGGAFDVRPALLLGGIGAVVGAAGALVVRIVSPKHPAPTNLRAIAGCLVGGVIGGPLGALAGLGQPMLAWLNPDVPRRDFATAFGAIGGVFVGAVAGALAGAALSRTIRRGAKPGDAAES